MLKRCFLAIALSLTLLSVSSYANDYKQELRSLDGDVVTVKYKVVKNNGQHTVIFDNPEKKLSLEHREKYDTYERVKVVCFDRNGSHRDTFSSSMATDAIVVNSDKMNFQWSEDGVVWIEDQSSIKLTLLVQEATLSIPVYLAYYEKKGTYTIFARCGKLDIPLDKGQSSSSSDSPSSPTATRTVTTSEQVETETELSDGEIALMLVDRIRELLGQSSSSSLPDGLDTYENQLRELELKITDKDTKAKITSVLSQIEAKKKEVEQIVGQINQDNAEETARQAAVKQAREDLSYVNERLDNIDDLSDDDVAALKADASQLRRQSHHIDDRQLAEDMRTAANRCDEQFNKIEQAKKRRNIWMIIGGIILAIAMFLGNHTLQHIRNLNSQRGLEEMQDKIARRAENEAKRRAQSMVRSKVSRAQNQARRKANDAIRDGVNKGINTVTKGKKGGISI